MKYKFPKDFMWGAATAAYQVEGGIKNDWTEYMKERAEDFARNAKEDYTFDVEMIGKFDESVWQSIEKEAKDPSNYIAGTGADHYNRYKEDLGLAKELNMNSYRFSIEWSRIEPEEGKFDEEAIKHYKDEIKFMRGSGIEPLVTLYHFTLPDWFAKKGGWRKRKNNKYFKRYVARMGEEFKDLVRHWITINEPLVYSFNTYTTGDFPPGKRYGIKFLKYIYNIVYAHIDAYKALKEVDQNFQVSFSKHLTDVKVHGSTILLYPFIKLYDYIFNFFFTNKVKNYMDFIGINFYQRVDINYSRLATGLSLAVLGRMVTQPKRMKINENDIVGISDMGWYLYPRGLYNMIKRYWKKYKLPIIVTEHGCADKNDRVRREYLEESLKLMSKAIDEGVDLRGYMHWSLLDNYEWHKGFWPRFGLIAVDYKTQKRTVRDSAKWYGEVAKNNGF